MNNFVASAQRFLKNKNTITILGVIGILVLLYIGYSTQINKAVEPVNVPVAVDTIQPRTEITDDMVQMVSMPNISLSDNVIRNKNNVVGKYSNINSVIPKGSMFYTDTVVEKSKLPDSVFVKVKKGEIVFNFPVDIESTYGNSIFPGNKIDIYMKTGNGTDEKVMLGKLVENVEVLAVKDSSGRDVFENTSEDRSPSMMIFGIPEEIHALLLKATYMGSLGVELFPVPHGGAVSTEGATEVSTQQLADYIEAHAVNIPVTTKTETDTLAPTVKVTNNKATIKFPKECKSKYTCTYTVTYDAALGINPEKGTVTKTSASVTLKGNGTLVALVTEKDGTEHRLEQAFTATTNTNTNNGILEQ
ncbi:MAG: hypothetical protein HFH45_01950 [Bacilli bacterium]|nr:hypothetical protein [Bacilli bacterium]